MAICHAYLEKHHCVYGVQRIFLIQMKWKLAEREQHLNSRFCQLFLFLPGEYIQLMSCKRLIPSSSSDQVIDLTAIKKRITIHLH